MSPENSCEAPIFHQAISLREPRLSCSTLRTPKQMSRGTGLRFAYRIWQFSSSGKGQPRLSGRCFGSELPDKVCRRR